MVDGQVPSGVIADSLLACRSFAAASSICSFADGAEPKKVPGIPVTEQTAATQNNDEPMANVVAFIERILSAHRRCEEEKKEKEKTEYVSEKTDPKEGPGGRKGRQNLGLQSRVQV